MTKQTVTIYIGIPASGKSTAANKAVNESMGRIVRVNKDTIRIQLHGNLPHSKEREKATEQERDRQILGALVLGKDVIVDDTNISKRHETHIRQLIHDVFNGRDIEVKQLWFHDSFNIDLCLERNAKREAVVPSRVIYDMHRLWMKRWIEEVNGDTFPLIKKDTVVTCLQVDIDGTVANANGRNPFHEKYVEQDLPIESMIQIVNDFRYIGEPIVFMSGRSEDCREETTRWLDRYFVGYELHMRETGDTRKDSYVKYDLYMKHVYPRYKVRMVFDDRMQVVHMWNSIGLPVLQLWSPGQHNFF